MNLVYEVPYWDAHQWQRFVELTPQALYAIAVGQSKIFSFPQFSTEVFSRLYSWDVEPLPKPKPEAAWAVKLHDELSQNQQFQDLQNLVGGNYHLSGLAATSFLAELAEQLPQPEQPIPDPQELRLQVLGQKRRGDRADQELIAHLIEQGKQAVQDTKDYVKDLDEGGVIAISKAASKAQTDVQDTITQMQGFSWDLTEGGADGKGGGIEEKVRLVNKINQSNKLKKIAKEAGRLKQMAAVKQQSKTKKARHTIESIETGNDLARILPSQALMLRLRQLKPLFIKGYSEKSLLQYKMGGRDRMGQGPVVVVLDSTGSMSGDREVWSKAVTLALLGIATIQKRHFRVIHYGLGARRVDDFPPGEYNSKKLLDSMEYFYNDGINWEPDALDAAVDCIDKNQHYKDADIVFITDGGWGVGSGRGKRDSSDWAKKFANDRKRLNFSVYAILIEDNRKQAIEEFIKPDQLIHLSSLRSDEAIAEVFSI